MALHLQYHAASSSPFVTSHNSFQPPGRRIEGGGREGGGVHCTEEEIPKDPCLNFFPSPGGNSDMPKLGVCRVHVLGWLRKGDSWTRKKEGKLQCVCGHAAYISLSRGENDRQTDVNGTSLAKFWRGGGVVFPLFRVSILLTVRKKLFRYGFLFKTHDGSLAAEIRGRKIRSCMTKKRIYGKEGEGENAKYRLLLLRFHLAAKTIALEHRHIPDRPQDGQKLSPWQFCEHQRYCLRNQSATTIPCKVIVRIRLGDGDIFVESHERVR